MEGRVFFSPRLCSESKTCKRCDKQISKKKGSLYIQNSYYFSLPFAYVIQQSQKISILGFAMQSLAQAPHFWPFIKSLAKYSLMTQLQIPLQHPGEFSERKSLFRAPHLPKDYHTHSSYFNKLLSGRLNPGQKQASSCQACNCQTTTNEKKNLWLLPKSWAEGQKRFDIFMKHLPSDIITTSSEAAPEGCTVVVEVACRAGTWQVNTRNVCTEIMGYRAAGRTWLQGMEVLPLMLSTCQQR